MLESAEYAYGKQVVSKCKRPNDHVTEQYKTKHILDRCCLERLRVSIELGGDCDE